MLIKKERGILLIIAFAVESLFIIIDLFYGEFLSSWYWIIPAFAVTNLLFYITSKNNSLTKTKDSCSDEKYIYTSDEGVISDFNIGTVWYSKKKYRIMRDTYLEIAKEYSGKKTYDEIEYMVREMIAYKLRKKSSLAIYYALATLPVISVMSVTEIETENLLLEFMFDFLLFSALLANLYGVLRAVSTIHDAVTPNESKDFSKEKEERQAKENEIRKQTLENKINQIRNSKSGKKDIILLSELYKDELEKCKEETRVKSLIILTLVFLAFISPFLFATIAFSLLFMVGVLVPSLFYFIFLFAKLESVKTAKQRISALNAKEIELCEKVLLDKNEDCVEGDDGVSYYYYLDFGEGRKQTNDCTYATADIGDIFYIVSYKNTSDIIEVYNKKEYTVENDFVDSFDVN